MEKCLLETQFDTKKGKGFATQRRKRNRAHQNLLANTFIQETHIARKDQNTKDMSQRFCCHSI
jgi:hypothetical protein